MFYLVYPPSHTAPPCEAHTQREGALLLKIPPHRRAQPVKLPRHQLASMLARMRELQLLGTLVSLLSEGVRESVLLPQQSLGTMVGWDLCSEGRLQTPGASVSLQPGPARGRGGTVARREP